MSVITKLMPFLPLLFLILSNCAVIHHTQIGEVDSRIVQKGEPFEILLSEYGVNFEEARDILKMTTRDARTAEHIEQVQLIISLFQMGPTTGNKVFSDDYADGMFLLIKETCPTGLYTGLTLVREMNKYPVVSGEIVKVRGYCWNPKGAKT